MCLVVRSGNGERFNRDVRMAGKYAIALVVGALADTIGFSPLFAVLQCSTC